MCARFVCDLLGFRAREFPAKSGGKLDIYHWPKVVYIWSSQLFKIDQVVDPVTNGEVKGGKPHVGVFFVPNIAVSQESMVLV